VAMGGFGLVVQLDTSKMIKLAIAKNVKILLFIEFSF
jgi:hypothetical protein